MKKLQGFRPHKALGQNFLINPRIVQKIIETSGLSEEDFVVEVGPGFGVLTEALLNIGARVIAVEKDERLFAFLKNKFKNVENLELIHADALAFNPPEEPFFLVANIPYSITSPLIDHFIRDNYKFLPKRAVLLVQKEVAQKICALPPDMNVLALHVQTFGDTKMEGIVSKNNFQPRPKVDSAIIKIDFPKKPKMNVDYEKYFGAIHRAFSKKRKMLRAVFGSDILEKAGIDPKRRPQTLSLSEWSKIASVLP